MNQEEKDKTLPEKLIYKCYIMYNNIYIYTQWFRVIFIID